MTLRVTVNELKCQSYRRCTAVAPAVFGISAASGKAEVLVTGDRDLHEITAKVPLDILTPRGLWERLRAPSAEH